jgi:GNAT superfamily N-acetyltransferase
MGDKPMSVIVRDCTMEDIDDIVFLMGELGYPTSYEDMKLRFMNISSDSSYCTLIADVKGKVVGLAGLHKSYMYEKTGINVSIIALVVQSDFRGKGIGRHLLLDAENWAKNQGAISMSLNSGNRSEREKAHLFYQRFGFTPKSTGFIKIIT